MGCGNNDDIWGSQNDVWGVLNDIWGDYRDKWGGLKRRVIHTPALAKFLRDKRRPTLINSIRCLFENDIRGGDLNILGSIMTNGAARDTVEVLQKEI
jgi:hypothetical protein